MRIPRDLRDKEEILRSIEVVENNEPLVKIKTHCPEISIKLFRGYYVKRKESEKVLVRKRVADMLNEARSLLPENIQLVIRDAWRTSQDQIMVFENLVLQYLKEHPEWDRKRAEKEAENFAAKIGENELPAPHTTGGAVDVTLAYKKTGKLLPMRKSYKRCGAGEWDRQKWHDYQNLPAYIIRNRKLLKSCMESVGFSPCPYEWWHYSHGDLYWAARTGKKTACYGPINN